MSIAITPTETRIGRRNLGVYHSRNIYRGPAEPGPRSADTVARRLSGMGVIPALAERNDPVSTMVRANPNQIVGLQHPQIETPTPISVNPDGTSSQAPTGVVINQAAPVNAQAVATVSQPSVIPTSTAQITPQGNPGYLVITSGGGTVANASPDYFSEIESWLTQQSLIAGFPNWAVALGAALVLGFAWKESSKR